MGLLSAGNNNGGMLGPLEALRTMSDQTAPADFSTNDLLSKNPLILMALGAGIAQGGIGRGLQLALRSMQTQRQESKEQDTRATTYAGLRSAGMPHGQAIVAAMNPEVFKTIARFHFTGVPTVPANQESELQASKGTLQIGNTVSDTRSQKLALLENALGHLGKLAESFDSQDGSKGSSVADLSYPNGNSIPRNFSALRDVAAQHVSTMLRAAGIADHDIQSSGVRKSTNLNELRHAIGRDIDLMHSRTNPSSPLSQAQAVSSPMLEGLSPTSRAILEKLRQAMKGESSEQPTN